jgi:hypothetical protein
MRCIQVTDEDWDYLMKRKIDQKARSVAVIVSELIKNENGKKA